MRRLVRLSFGAILLFGAFFAGRGSQSWGDNPGVNVAPVTGLVCTAAATVDWDATWVGDRLLAAPAYEVQDVRVSGLPAACDTGLASATLLLADGRRITVRSAAPLKRVGGDYIASFSFASTHINSGDVVRILSSFTPAG
jgi:hypothetical protein